MSSYHFTITHFAYNPKAAYPYGQAAFGILPWSG